jgi:hypothetical protein
MGRPLPPAPPWHVIEPITTAQVIATIGRLQTAAAMLCDAIKDAEVLRLPHQDLSVQTSHKPGDLPPTRAEASRQPICSARATMMPAGPRR